MKKRFEEYYENLDIAHHEAIGFFYAAFMFIGVYIGTLIGFIASGGKEMFFSGGWIDVLVGMIIGGIIGIGFGLISNAIILLKKNNKLVVMLFVKL
ncbi:hypothetical protein [Ureibacillus sp. FSL W8-0352]|uniref:hypothetical protein n=1 Tax=Ureibacillus sp. FSL W8-0352 TaxID=2954596 RepID=UPI0030FB803E